jgi:hypothetical protein
MSSAALEVGAAFALPIKIGDERHTQIVLVSELLERIQKLEREVTHFKWRLENALRGRAKDAVEDSPEMEAGLGQGHCVGRPDDADANGVPESVEEDCISESDINAVAKLFNADVAPSSYGITVTGIEGD